MRCASFVVQDHTLASQTFFKPVITQVQFGHGLLQIAILALEARYFIRIGFSHGIARQPLLAGLQEVFAPAVVQDWD